MSTSSYIEILKGLKPYQLELGESYQIMWNNKLFEVKLIQPTKKGYNFLLLKSYKCLYFRPFYISKYPEHKEGLWFWLPIEMNIKKMRDNE